MKLSEIKNVKSFCEDLFSQPDWREVVSNLADQESDFWVDGVRFINSDSIDEIQQEELLSDLYVLGFFNADFLSGHIPLDSDEIKAIQDAGAYEAIGKIAAKEIESIQSEYASLDGYGHHFNSYDFGEDEIRVNGDLYHVFDNH